MLDEIVRKELKARRNEAHMNQSDVAFKVGISGSAYQRIEYGYVDPKPSVAEKLIELFDLPADYFCN